MYYDYHKILSYNCLLNFIIGERGVGKTFGITDFVTSKFIKDKSEFAFIRRYKSELKEVVPNFFDSIKSQEKYKDVKLYSKGDKFYCNDKICGYSMTLSTAQKLKSVNFPNVKYIIFDEFIIEEGQRTYYLKNEVFVFLNLIETIARMRDVNIFLLGNAGSSINPYFLYFDLTLPYNSDIKLFKDNTILLQYIKNEEYRQAKKETNFGKLVAHTSFDDYAINNNFINDNKNFIEKKKATSKFKFAFIYDNLTYRCMV